MIKAKVITDSISTHTGQRITTFELEYNRYIHGELMTHRCITGDTKLAFDLPTAKNNSKTRVHTLTVKDFFDKWTNGGALRLPSRLQQRDLSKINPAVIYSAKELSVLAGFKSPANIRTKCRKGNLIAQNPNKAKNQDWLILGSDYLDFESSSREFPQAIRHRLEQMNLRCLDEVTNTLSHTNINDIWEVGIKKTYKLIAGKLDITATDDHLILTNNGWKEVKDIQVNVDSVISLSMGKLDLADPIRLKNYCHKNVHHKKQGWQTGNPLIGKPVLVTSIEYVGDQTVYDLSVVSEQHNFVANGIVIHNCFSRNSSSSRAIPIQTMINHVKDNTAIPTHWGKNQSGMQAKTEVEDSVKQTAMQIWLQARDDAISHAQRLAANGLHKQIVNRILEPFQMMKVVVTATNFDNWFNLRLHPDAQPEIHKLAKVMYEALALSEPMELSYGEWHLPYIERERDEEGELKYFVYNQDEDPSSETYGHQYIVSLTLEQAQKISCSCCAQVSYRKSDNSIEKAIAIYDRLVNSKPVHCYDDKTAVLTLTGFKAWADVTVKDSLAVVNPETNKVIGFKPPFNLTRDYYDGLMLNIERKNISMSITPNHKIYGYQRRKAGDWNKRQDNCYYLYVAQEPTNSLSNKLNYEVMQAIPTCSSGVDLQGTQVDFYLGQLYGFFIGDGFIPKDCPNRICFRLKKERKIEYIKTVLNNLNLPINLKVYSDTMVIKSQPLQAFHDCYGENHAKKFPEGWMEKPQQFLLGLFDGLINSDGYTDPRRKETYSFSTTSKSVADSMVSLSAIAGLGSCSIYENKKNTQSKLVYQVTVRKAKEAIVNDSRNPSSYIKPKHYKGMVYCADTGGNVLILKRNGNTFLSGNSSAFEHCATPAIGAYYEYGTVDFSILDKGVTHVNTNMEPCSGNFTNWIQYRQLIPNHDCKEFSLESL